MGNVWDVWNPWATNSDELEGVLTDWFGPQISVFGFEIPTSVAAQVAWINPASGIGLAARLGLAGRSQRGQSIADVQPTMDTVGQQLLNGGSWGASIPSSTEAVGRALSTQAGASDVAQLVIPNVYRATVEMAIGAQAVVNVFHFRGTSSGQEQACATALLTAWKKTGGPLVNLGNSSLSMKQVQVVDLSTTSGGIWTILDATAGVGTNQMATAAASALIQWNGGTRNRNSRGRTYFGPLREADVAADGRTLSTTTATALTTMLNTFRSDMVTAGFSLGVASRTTAQFFPVTRQVIAPIIATQRRRIRS